VGPAERCPDKTHTWPPLRPPQAPKGLLAPSGLLTGLGGQKTCRQLPKPDFRGGGEALALQ